MKTISKVYYNGKVIGNKKSVQDYTHAVVLVYSNGQTKIVSYATNELDANIIANNTNPKVVIAKVQTV